VGLPVRVDNDVNAFALAEWRWGAGEQKSNVVFLTLGTGIGGAVIADGRLIRGSGGFAAEPGHATLVLEGIPCPCGNRGCAERYVGSRAIVDAALAHPGYGADPQLGAMVTLSPETIAEAARQGSAVAGEVFESAGVALGGLLVTLVNIFNPDSVVIGGGVAQAGDLLLDPARKHVARCSLVARYAPPAILSAALGEPAGVLGAAALFLDNVGNTERP
jgi:glucokinase